MRILINLYILVCYALVGTLAYNQLLPVVSDTPTTVPYSALFRPTNRLHSSYLQGGGKSAHQRADLVFDTTIPSVNPDSVGALKNIECDNGNITLTLNDADYLQTVDSSWPDGDVLMLITHQWHCFGKQTTQYFMAGNKTILKDENKVVFTTRPCDIFKWSNSFSLDVTWENPQNNNSSSSKKKTASKKHNKKSHSRRKRRGLSKILGDDSSISVDKQNKISLDILFDEKTGKSSLPNIPLIKVGQPFGTNITSLSESLLCANCFVNGEATITLHIEGQFLPIPEITNATLAIDGNINFNFDISVNGGVGVAPTTPDIQIVEIPLTPLGIPNVFNIGPALILAASAQVSTTVTGSLYTGTAIAYPNFHMSASLLNNTDPGFEQSGFNGVTTPKTPSTGISESVGISGSLKPQLALDLDILNGLLQAKTGFQLVATLGADITFGSNGCNPNQRLIETDLTGGVGFFVESFSSPTINFAHKVLAQKCI